MTGGPPPVLAAPSPNLADIITMNTQAVMENAQRLGLQWRIIPGTVAFIADPYVVVAMDEGSVVRMVNLSGESPVVGMRVMVLETSSTTRFIIGTLGGLLAKSVYARVDAIGTTTSNTYAIPSNSVGAAFIAPPSGTVRIDWSAEVGNNVASVFGALAPQVREDSAIGFGTVIWPATDGVFIRSSQVNAGDQAVLSNFFILNGLVPGNDYNVQLLGKTTGVATANFEFQTVIITPHGALG